MAKSANALGKYQEMRDFEETPEPRGTIKKKSGWRFVIQKHAARRLHYDFRLELDGVLKSWAVTKGPSLDPADKRLAVRTEDHPVDYGDFEGVIPSGYGAGTVILWDKGTWKPKGDPGEGLKRGSLKFELDGERLKGGFALVRMKNKTGEKRENWLLVKERDGEENETIDPTREWTTSVVSDRDLKQVKADAGKKSAPAKKKASKKPAARKRNAKSKTPTRAVNFVAPQLATLADAPPKGDDWLHELKYDGYRIQAHLHNGKVRLYTRNQKNWTSRYGPVADAVAELDAEQAVLDGELIALDKRGHSDFGALQNAGEDPSTVLVYYAFDLLYLDGEDLRKRPLTERKERLEALVKDVGDPIRYSDHIAGDGDRVIEKACAMNLEGLVSKKASAAYHSGRRSSWIKSKCLGLDEFVIAGYRRSDKRGRPFSSLLLGEYENGELVYRGRVGTGFDDATLDMLISKMRALERKTSPYAATPAEAKRGAVWVTPSLVAQIRYTEKTGDGRLRHPAYLGLREDKAAMEVTMNAGADKGETDRIGGVRLTSPDKVLYSEQGTTKRALAEYYLEHAEHILPYLKGRPLSLVRCPEGREGECFFQKHHNKTTPDEMKSVVIKSKDGGEEPYLVIEDEKGLVAAAQIGALELHLWGARSDRVERPERIIFDLDPDEKITFEDVRAAAFQVRDVLGALGLESFPLLTGGKGVHVIAPIERRRDWPDVKRFCKGLATSLEKAAPEKYVATASKAKRKGRIFVDWLRNERGATAVAPYSPRARRGAPVATPVSWAELKKASSASAYDISAIGKRLAALKKDPWAGYFDIRQSITGAMLDAVENGDIATG